jgi:hypothetical protein
MPVDLFLMVDRTISMMEPVAGADHTRWEAMNVAIEQFVTDPEALDRRIRVGINFFNQTGGYTPEIDCAISSYSNPEGIGVLRRAAIERPSLSELRDEVPSLSWHPAPGRRGRVIANEEASSHGIALLAALETDAGTVTAAGVWQFRLESIVAQARVWLRAPVHACEILKLWHAEPWIGADAVIDAMGHEVSNGPVVTGRGSTHGAP